MKKYELELTDEAEAFLGGLKESTRKKFITKFRKVEQGIITKDDFKKLPGTSGLWEFRVADNNTWYRIFSFFGKYEGKVIATIVLINGYQKTGNKAPASEIERAERLKSKYS
jgi:phage-related protein